MQGPRSPHAPEHEVGIEDNEHDGTENLDSRGYPNITAKNQYSEEGYTQRKITYR